MKRKVFSHCLAAILLFTGISVQAQENRDSVLSNATLEQCVQYALAHQPQVQQSLLDEAITEQTIKSKLADWYPQLNFNFTLQHNFQVPTNVFGGNTVKLGVDNTSSAQFILQQNIFNRDALLASRTAGIVRNYAKLSTSENKIDAAVNVTKAFYDVLTTLQQIKVAAEDINRLERSQQDAYQRYTTGIADKTDYKRAFIALNNAKATLRNNEEALKAKEQYLKFLMGYPVSASLDIVYDTLQMESELVLDTLQSIDYTRRIEYRVLSAQKKIQEANLAYNKWSFLPSVTAGGAYNFNFLNNDFGKLYNKNFPSSFANLTLSFPIFQGGKRRANINAAELQVKRIDWDLVNLQHAIDAEYAQAMAVYKSSLENYYLLKENLAAALEVYDVINRQYGAGIKTYLEVINAETDLRSARINYYNALYRVLSSKTDVQKSLGLINY